MDLARSCKYSYMRPYRDRPDVLVLGRWYFCRPGAAFLPFPHVYGSSLWDGEELADAPPVGEVREQFGYSKQRGSPRFPGVKPCGSAFTWGNGALYSQKGTPAVDVDGVPLCCAPAELLAGPGEIGGNALVVFGSGLTAQGGGMANGAGLFLPGFTSLTGVKADGAGDFGVGLLGSGGSLADGAGWWSWTLAATGGSLADGAGAFGSGFVSEGGGLANSSGVFYSGFAGEGGLEANGGGWWNWTLAATGGSLADGAGWWNWTLGGAGGGLANSSGVFYSGFAGEGGLEGNGGGDFGVGWESEGGVLADGEGDFSTGGGDVVETGVIVGYGNVTAPTGWLNCDGAAVSRSTYSALYAVVGTSFGIGDGSTTFNVPDLRSRVPIGSGGGSGLQTYSIGQNGGVEAHTLSTSEIPGHTHAQNANTVLTAGAVLAIGTGVMPLYATGGTTGSAGGGGSHENRQPFQALNFIIKT